MSKLNFNDFMVKSLFEKAAKMELLMDGKKTEHFLMVKGIEDPSTQRDRVQSQVSYRNLEKALKDEEDEVTKALKERDGVEAIQIVYASKLIDSWSFGDCTEGDKLKLLGENIGLAALVIGFSASVSNYRKKK